MTSVDHPSRISSAGVSESHLAEDALVRSIKLTPGYYSVPRNEVISTWISLSSTHHQKEAYRAKNISLFYCGIPLYATAVFDNDRYVFKLPLNLRDKMTTDNMYADFR